MRLQDNILAAALALCAPWAPAQTVYRCGSSYSQQPCAGATALEVSDPRTPADAARAGKAAAGDAKRADAMEKERLAQEKNAPKGLVIGAKEAPPQAVKPAAKGKKKEPASDPNVFTATGKKP